MDDIKEEYYPNGKLESTVPTLNGVKHGLQKLYYETGELMYEGEFQNDKQEGLWKLYYENGDIKRENIFENHKKISQKEFYPGNKLKFEGKYIDNYKKNGKWLYYYKNGTIKKEEIFDNHFTQSQKIWNKNGVLRLEENQTKIDTQTNERYGVRKEYFKNGNLKLESNLKSGQFGFFKHGSYKRYFKNHQTKSEGEFERGSKFGKWVTYFQNSEIKKEEFFNNDICESIKEWDKDGNIIKEEVLKQGDIRIRIIHEVKTKGNFHLELKDGTKTYVFGQYHKLDKVEEEYDDGEWYELEDNRIEIDNFYLTGSEEGFLYELDDIPKFFETEYWGDWDYNGDSDNWCGIEDEDDYETCMKKWKDYKSKFPRVTSREQFRLIDNYRN